MRICETRSSDLNTEHERLSYWDHYYQEHATVSIPSQFAVFLCDFLQPAQNVMEFGCGDGRDSFFLASHGYTLLGLDASEQAIAACRQKLARQVNVRADFHQLHVRADWSAEQIISKARELRKLVDSAKPTAIYARFFLHVITEQEEIAFLRLVKETIAGGVCAVEFRTHRDSLLKKETSPHYRRYLDPLGFHARAAATGLEPVYFTEGFGLAKYKTDDAHVARFVLRERAGDKP
jgi:ubiquinone/menaquinone biosynthesis C-methylase UbiE